MSIIIKLKLQGQFRRYLPNLSVYLKIEDIKPIKRFFIMSLRSFTREGTLGAGGQKLSEGINDGAHQLCISV